MKSNFVKMFLAILVTAFCCVGSLEAQNIGIIKKSARTAAAGITVSTTNGKTTVSYKGKEVWTGKPSAKISGRTKLVGNQEYAAAFDGDKVIWENVPGAGAKVK